MHYKRERGGGMAVVSVVERILPLVPVTKHELPRVSLLHEN